MRSRILRIEEDEKKVGLSMRGVAQPSEEEVAELKRPPARKAGEEVKAIREAAKKTVVVKSAADVEERQEAEKPAGEQAPAEPVTAETE